MPIYSLSETGKVEFGLSGSRPLKPEGGVEKYKWKKFTPLKITPCYATDTIILY